MFVKFKTGPRAGEIAEMKFSDAQALLADGRAEKYPADDAPESSAPPAPAAQPKRKGKKR